MHVQRAALLVPAVIGAIGVALSVVPPAAGGPFLMWITPSFDLDLSALGAAGDEAILNPWKIRMDLISLVCFALAVVMVVAGGFRRPVDFLARLTCFVLALVPILAAGMMVASYSTLVRGWFDRYNTIDSELLWPGFATWLTLAAALVMVLTSLVVGWIGREPKAAAPSPATGAGA